MMQQTLSKKLRIASEARPAWAGRPTIWGSTLRGVAFLILCVLVLFPFLVVVSTSIATQEALDANGGFVIFPTDVSFQAYDQIFNGGVVTRALLVSAGVTLTGTAISLLTTVLAAYGLSRTGSLFQKPLLTIVLLTFLFAPGIIPLYLMVKQLGLLNNYWALILPVAVNAFNLVIVRGFFMNIPKELLEAARIDGASEWRTLFQIVMPLSKGVIAVIGLFYAVSYWNAFFSSMLYLNDSTMWPLQLVLRTYVLQATPLVSDTMMALPPMQSVQMAVVVIAVVPIVAVYPFLQRHLSKGVLTGAVKG
ncbi:putative ABC-type sugar transport system, permease component [Arthrobacter sp. PAMC 25486]|uniref:carbohydrate ABC transporter permease n=1 Tax=Arthrobacter sp. PAMC 25486 TaxID=1494608 RepID=UPI000535E5C6|nr:carbohydrate ABC transporter permease [Arthrobacter sp. PAMC 25486]AIY03194.1 putative ABC-type sugar transport system, permease component [Arthrobacter sp. PAMC 25486]